MLYSPDRNDQLLTLLQSIENELRTPPVVQQRQPFMDIPLQSPRRRPPPPPPRAVSHPITPSQIQPNVTAPVVHQGAPSPNGTLQTVNTVANTVKVAASVANTASKIDWGGAASAISSLF